MREAVFVMGGSELDSTAAFHESRVRTSVLSVPNQRIQGKLLTSLSLGFLICETRVPLPPLITPPQLPRVVVRNYRRSLM